MSIVYALRCECNKWYIGKTDCINRRYRDHVNGRGAVWTRKYKPLCLAATIQNASPFDEDKVTKEYMAKYGIDNVRGGSYIAEVLDPGQIVLLQREIWMAKNQCMRCGSSGHFVKECGKLWSDSVASVTAVTAAEAGRAEAQQEVIDDTISVDSLDHEETEVYCGYCNDSFAQKEECAKHVRNCKTPITFAPLIKPGILPLSHVAQLICRYIRQQKDIRGNADFPIGSQYDIHLTSIALLVLTHCKRQTRIYEPTFRILRTCSSMYICRVEWKRF